MKITSLCPEFDKRNAMSDDDFWDYVFNRDNAEVEDYEPPEVSKIDIPCTVCGEQGACGYDNEGRPMIHTTEEEDDDDTTT